VFEHITTKHAAQYVAEAEGPIAATITAHHLLYNRNEIFRGGINPHYYCLPVLKREEHRLALVTAATSGDERFFLGTDSAPHAIGAKQSSCGCAGCYTALHAVEMYAEAFEQAGALDKLEAFASLNGPAFYGLPVNSGTITLKREAWTLPDTVPMGESQLVPLNGGEQINWKML
jgi:dihydroorotase